MAFKKRLRLYFKGVVALAFCICSAQILIGCSDEPKGKDAESSAKSEEVLPKPASVKERMADTNYVNGLRKNMAERKKIEKMGHEARQMLKVLKERAAKNLELAATATVAQVEAEWAAHPEKYPELAQARAALAAMQKMREENHKRGRKLVQERLGKEMGVSERIRAAAAERMKRHAERRAKRLAAEQEVLKKRNAKEATSPQTSANATK